MWGLYQVLKTLVSLKKNDEKDNELLEVLLLFFIFFQIKTELKNKKIKYLVNRIKYQGIL